MLRDLELKRRYRSSSDDFVRDFFVPCLRNANRYHRAVGYYSSASLSAAADGLAGFIKEGGVMRLVASPELSERDLAAIAEGYEQKDAAITRTITSPLLTGYPGSVARRLGLLGQLISQGRLEIKLAVLKRADGTAGIYHEKLGVFEDEASDCVAFFGSANESKGGLKSNFESFVVFRSWLEADIEDVEAIRSDFDALWENRTPNLEVFDFPEAGVEALARLATPGQEGDVRGKRATALSAADRFPIETSQPRTSSPLRMPAGFELRTYQQDGIVSWLRNDGRGILEMATGTGKTYTALAATARLYEHLKAGGKPLFCVVVCPYQHLVRQWAVAASEFGIDPVCCYRSVDQWKDRLIEEVHATRIGAADFALAIATNSTFAGDAFKDIAAEFPRRTLLIADEAHNLGAKKARAALTDSYRYRLALSATPERAYDDEGTDFLNAYFGGTVFSFGLAEAIEAGALTPYEYFPHVVYLEDEELDQYLHLTAKIARLSFADEDQKVEGPLLMLLVQRARILAGAQGKLSALAEVVRPLSDTTHNLFYCGDGTVDKGETTAERQLDAVVKVLGLQLGMRVQSYTHENFAEQRDLLRERFARGDLQGLVAIRCLDEGVDIPETKRAFILASSTNPRQFVQRRGRVLRRAPGKESATIHDFLVLPPPDSVPPELWQTERRLVERELNRIGLFAKLALNGVQALRSLVDVRERYELLHIG
jgi:DNA phosphorothioation system restriction enzyme